MPRASADAPRSFRIAQNTFLIPRRKQSATNADAINERPPLGAEVAAPASTPARSLIEQPSSTADQSIMSGYPSRLLDDQRSMRVAVGGSPALAFPIAASIATA